MDVLVGTIERITFYNEENGYTVLKISTEEAYPEAQARDGTVTVIGVMPELTPGESVRFSGQWVDDARWGRQFRAEAVVPMPPVTRDGIIRYLSSGIVRGIGDKTAEKIVDYWGLETLNILDTDPERIRDTPQLKSSLANDLIAVWGTLRKEREAMIVLQGYGISSRFAARIFREYGDLTIKIVQANPYRLADEVFGIGFKRADAIARGMGMGLDAPERLRAGLEYTLNHLSSNGHTYAPREVLLETAAELLEVEERDLLEAALEEQIAAKELFQETIQRDAETIEAVYLPMFYHSERGSARLLAQLANNPSPMQRDAASTNWDSYLPELARRHDLTLTPQQQGAVQAVLTHKVSVLTGGPGTGKTTTLQMVIHALEDGGYRYALASPTGRAAKRLGEATERPASTIHRLLGYSPADGFLYNEEMPLEVRALIVDEASMIDLLLFYNLLKALPPYAHLMLVGDVDQLPSVGPGNVLRDVIDSGLAQVTRLTQIFRQDDSSHIVVNAHRINEGQMPFVDNDSSDFFFFRVADAARVAEMVVDVVSKRLPERFGVDPVRDVQVLSPMYRGPAGVDALNSALQAALNSDRRMAYKQLGGRIYRVGDKVMQVRNNYEKDVFNGDIGRIYGIDFDDQTLEVVIDGRYIMYDFSEAADDLIHAYCISTHRSQGSEYPVVVMPIIPGHYMMLQRNLLYTAITRAREIVVLVGDQRAVYTAVHNNRVAERFSGLVNRLQYGG